MSKTVKLLIGILVVGILSAFFVWQYVNKPTKDLSNEKVEILVNCSSILKKLDTDTSSVSYIMNQIIAIEGTVKKISKDQQYITIELGDSTTQSSVVCQIDARHKTDFETVIEGNKIIIQGKVSAFTFDEELGLGNSIQMNFCTLYKK